MNKLKMNKSQISYDEYVQIVDEKVNLIDNETTEIVVFLYNDSWTAQECIQHIDSVRRFNKTLENK